MVRVCMHCTFEYVYIRTCMYVCVCVCVCVGGWVGGCGCACVHARYHSLT